MGKIDTIKLVRDVLVIIFVAFMLTFFAYPLISGAASPNKVITITVGQAG